MNRFERYLPDERLRPYVKEFVISENSEAQRYKVLPVAGIVMGFQYSGALRLVKNSEESHLSNAGITGFTDRYRIYRNTSNIGTVLVYFTPTGLSHFTDCPASHLFSESLSLDHIFAKSKISEVTDRLAGVTTDLQRISIVEHFLFSVLINRRPHLMLEAAVRHIYQTNGAASVKALIGHLNTSRSVLERNFKAHIGITPKKFSSIIRLNHILKHLKTDMPLLDICYENHYFDQAHFINDFKKFTGIAPEEFRLDK